MNHVEYMRAVALEAKPLGFEEVMAPFPYLGALRMPGGGGHVRLRVDLGNRPRWSVDHCPWEAIPALGQLHAIIEGITPERLDPLPRSSGDPASKFLANGPTGFGSGDQGDTSGT